jgi:peptidoglycan hydrolase-like protein with peptidoglycan-binding domain
MLSVLAAYIPEIPDLTIDGVFGPATYNAVIAAQRRFGLPQTGIVNAATWDEIYDQFSGIENRTFRSAETFPDGQTGTTAPNANRTRYSRSPTMTQFPGQNLQTGSRDPVSQEVVR